MHSIRFWLPAALGLTALLTACGGGGTPQPLALGPAASPSPTPFNGRLYVEFGSTGAPAAQGVAAYALPILAGARPQFILSGTFGPLAFSPSGDMLTALQSEIDKYPAPLSAASSAVPLITAGPATLPSSPVDLQFDPLGNLWVQTANDLREFPAPLAAGEAATTIVAATGASIIFDPQSGALYDGPMSVPFGNTPFIKVFKTYPYTAPPKTLALPFGAPLGFDGNGNAIAYSSGYMPGMQQSAPALTLIHLPLSSASQSTAAVNFTLYAGQSAAHPAVVDPLGNVYAVDAAAGNAVAVFAAPFASGSSPAVHISCVPAPSGCAPAIALYIGP